MSRAPDRLRIALLSEVFLPKIDGVTRRLSCTVPELRRLGHEIMLFVPEDASPEFPGCRIHRVPGVRFPPEPSLRMSLPSPGFALALRRFDPQVVHALAPTCLGLFGLGVARALGIPRVASYHTDLPRYLSAYGLAALEPWVWPFLRRAHALAELTLCPSPSVRRELRAHGIPVGGLWRGAVDTDAFNPRHRDLRWRRQIAGGTDLPVVAVAGRLAPEKGLRILRDVIPRVPDAVFAVLGDGPLRRELEAELQGSRCRFLGFLQGGAYSRALASADALFHPSPTETMGFSVLEAMASGCPIVAADGGAVPDRVRAAEAGWLFPPGDAVRASEALGAALAAPAARAEAGERARKHTLESSWERETRILVDAYRSVL